MEGLRIQACKFEKAVYEILDWVIWRHFRVSIKGCILFLIY